MAPALESPHLIDNRCESIVAIEVKPYSIKELRNLYQVSEKTFSRWLEPFKKEIGCKRGRIYTVLQVELIFLRLGIPYILKEKT